MADIETPLQDFQGSVFLANLHHSFAQTDGSYKHPNSLEGDLLKQEWEYGSRSEEIQLRVHDEREG
jgi:hypothetical protein